MNIVKSMMLTYKSCKVWLDKYEEDLEELIWTLTNSKGISYEEQAGGTPMSMDMRGAINADLIEEWERERKRKKSLCESIVETCNEWLELVPKEYYEIFDYWMKYQATYEWIGFKCHMSKSNVDKIINRVTHELASSVDVSTDKP